MNNIETLLRRHSEGTLTPDEQMELDRLTHREQVLEAATHQARQIRRHRHTSITAVASVVLVAGSLFFFRTGGDAAKTTLPTVAQVQPQPTQSDTMLGVQSTLAETAQPKHIAKVENTRQLVESVVREDSTPRHQSVKAQVVDDFEDMAPAAFVADEQVVACNTQCSPDSVINDIWKFLRT